MTREYQGHNGSGIYHEINNATCKKYDLTIAYENIYVILWKAISEYIF